MAETHIISGLVKQRADVAGKIANLEAQAAEAKQMLVHIDAILRFNGYEGPELIRPNRGSGQLFRTGQLQRFIFDQLRLHSEGCTVRQMALEICAHVGWDVSEQGIVEKVIRSVSHALRGLEKKRFVTSEIKENRTGVWRLNASRGTKAPT